MAEITLQASTGPARRVRALVAASLMALLVSGCLGRSPTTTGSIGSSSPSSGSQEAWRRYSAEWGQRFDANPADATAALNYARALRALDQNAQAVAVLQQAAIRNPKQLEVLGAYGKALVEVGRYREASEVLTRAHTPERPDWRILSAQGTVADQMGDHAKAQPYYEAALKIQPNEPSILSNLGLSYALSKRLPDAERVLSQAASHPAADARIRKNYALVLGLQGKFDEAGRVLARDMQADEVQAAVAGFRTMVSQTNSWSAIRQTAGTRPKRAPAAESDADAPKG